MIRKKVASCRQADDRKPKSSSIATTSHRPHPASAQAFFLRQGFGKASADIQRAGFDAFSISELEILYAFVHISCMATKTISLEIDAYERLKACKRHGESFSAVVRRAEFPDSPSTGRSILQHLRATSARAPESDLRAIEEAARNEPPPSDPWK
jgi:hypothetical protein